MNSKTKNMKVTSINQSKWLLKQGVGVETADATIFYRENQNKRHVVFFYDLNYSKSMIDGGWKVIPAWTIRSLIRLLDEAINDSDMFLKRIAINRITEGLDKLKI